MAEVFDRWLKGILRGASGMYLCKHVMSVVEILRIMHGKGFDVSHHLQQPIIIVLNSL